MRIGVDVGGTKIEAIALDREGRELARRRVATPARDYAKTIDAVRALVVGLERELGAGRARVGVGMPGAISSLTGLVKNANSTPLNGRPLVEDLARASAARSGSRTTPTASRCRRRATAPAPAGAWCSA